MKMLQAMVAGAAFAALVAAPASAQNLGIGAAAPQLNTEMTAARESALRDCTEISRKYSEPTWGDMQMQTQRACMTEHSQAE